MMRKLWLASIAALMSVPVCSVLGDTHTTGVPVLNSRPGAAYTLYLDPAGFNYTGNWSANEIAPPGSTPALNLNGEATNISTFTATDQSDIKTLWSRVAQSYACFNVNVTTVDPAVAAGQAATDAARQAYYDATPDMMHMVIGSQIRSGNTNWYSNAADGVSGLGVITGVAANSGGHTNWMFSDSTGEHLTAGAADYIGAVAAHENGHSLGLYHQSDYTGDTLVNEYSLGDNSTANGTYVPIIGQASGAQRVTWRLGDSDNQTPTHKENDVAIIAANADMGGYVEDGKGHTRQTATPLALTGGSVDFTLDKGTISPLSVANPQPIGVDNYTKDWFSFTLSKSSAITLTANDSTEFLTPGTADGVGTLRSTLQLFDSNGNPLANGTATEDPSTLFETYTGTLSPGTYFFDVASFGGHDQVAPSFNAATYYDMGAYFLTGSGFDTVPEPGTCGLLLGFGSVSLFRRRRRTPRPKRWA